MLAKSRSESVTGRIRMFDRNSSGISSGRIQAGTPEGTVASLK